MKVDHWVDSRPAMKSPNEPHSGLFPPTAWSRIQAGRGDGSEEEMREALETICCRY
jgi:hypothetical protein